MAAISAEAFAVVGKPDSRVVVLGAGEEEIAVPVVLEEREWPLVALHQNWPHLRLGFLRANLGMVVNGKASGTQNLEEVCLGKSFGILEANKQNKEKRGRESPTCSQNASKIMKNYVQMEYMLNNVCFPLFLIIN